MGFGGEELLDETHCCGPLVNECDLEGEASRVPVELERKDESTEDIQDNLVCLPFKAG